MKIIFGSLMSNSKFANNLAIVNLILCGLLLIIFITNQPQWVAAVIAIAIPTIVLDVCLLAQNIAWKLREGQDASI